MIYWPFLTPKSRHDVTFMATISLSLEVSPQKFKKTLLWYWRRLVPNFTPIGEVPVEKTMTKQKKEKTTKKERNSKLSIPPTLHMEG